MTPKMYTREEMDLACSEARLTEVMTARAKYHSTQEFERQFVVVMYLDKRVSELEGCVEHEKKVLAQQLRWKIVRF
jgi:hypothetical protein